LQKWKHHADFKFVIRDRAEFDTTIAFIKKLCVNKDILEMFKDKVYFMPEGIKEGQIKSKMEQMAEWIKELGWGHLSPRMQILLWGNIRGT